MRLALIHSRLQQFSGAETQLFNFLQQAAARQISVHLIVSHQAAFANLPENVTLHKMSDPAWPEPFRQPAIHQKLQKLLHRIQPDITYAMRPIKGAEVLLCNGTLPGLYQAMEKKGNGFNYKLKTAYQQEAFRSANIILAVSGMMQRELLNYYKIFDHKIEVLPPPVNHQRYHTGLRQQRSLYQQQYGISPDKTSFLFVSTQNKRKGWPLIEEVFAALQHDPRFELIIAGTQPPANLLPNMRYVGYVKRTEELLTAVDYTLMPSRYEPFGLAAIESVLCGTPVLVSQHVGAKEMLSPSEGIILADLQVATLQETIMHLDEYTFDIPADFAAQKQLTPVQHFDRWLKICGFDPNQYPVLNT